MELDFISSEKAEGITHVLLASPFMHMSQHGVEVTSSSAKVFGQGTLSAALCLSPWKPCLDCSGQRGKVVVALV